MENGCRLVLRNSRKKNAYTCWDLTGRIVDRFKKDNEQKLRDNNGEIETRLRFEILLKDYATCSQPCDAS